MSTLRALLLGSANSGPTLDLRFADGSPLDGRLNFTRTSTASYFDATGTLQAANSNVPRIDYGPLNVTTNVIRNSTMQGVVPGTGTLPTNWGISANFGLTFQVVGAGTESGLPYVDVRWSGTTSSAGQLAIFFEAVNGAAALSGQPWTVSSYLRITAGSLANITAPVLFFDEYSSTSTFLTSGSSVVSFGATDLASGRQSYTRTLVNASTAFVRPSVRMSVASGVVVDITLRIGAPQLEQTAVATPWVPTSGTVNSAIATPGGRTNWIRNSSATGAVAGTPGTLPTNWANFATSGLTQQIVGSGTVNGIPYVDLRLSGTSNNTFAVFALDGNGAAAAPGQTWTESVYLALVAGSLSGVTTNVDLRWTPGGTSDTAVAVNATLTRLSGTGVAPATTTVVVPAIYFNFSNATAYDFTVRIGAPQLELGVTPTAWIPTTTAAANVGALPLGLLVEEQRTNSIRNPRCEGAVAGTPGTPPTNWAIGQAAGFTRQIVGTGVENGIPYLDVLFSGTNSSGSTDTSIQLKYESTTSIAATNGQTWAASMYMRLVAGSLAGLTLAHQIWQFNASVSFLVGSTFSTATPTGAPLASPRISGAVTLAQATVATIHPMTLISVPNGTTFNFTLRIGAPQLELGAFATSLILPTAGSPAAMTRGLDLATIPFASTMQSVSFLAEGICEAQPTGNAVLMEADDASMSGSNRAVAYVIANALTPNFTCIGGGIANGITGPSVPLGSVVKIGGTYNGNVLVSVSSGQVQGAVPLAVPIIPAAIMGIGSKPAGPGTLNGWMRRARYWPRALSSGELAAVTI